MNTYITRMCHLAPAQIGYPAGGKPYTLGRPAIMAYMEVGRAGPGMEWAVVGDDPLNDNNPYFAKIMSTKGAPTWWCHKCQVEVYGEGCKHCGKLEEDEE